MMALHKEFPNGMTDYEGGTCKLIHWHNTMNNQHLALTNVLECVGMVVLYHPHRNGLFARMVAFPCMHTTPLCRKEKEYNLYSGISSQGIQIMEGSKGDDIDCLRRPIAER